jgi:hypothetical protein
MLEGKLGKAQAIAGKARREVKQGAAPFVFEMRLAALETAIAAADKAAQMANQINDGLEGAIHAARMAKVACPTHSSAANLCTFVGPRGSARKWKSESSLGRSGATLRWFSRRVSSWTGSRR